MKRIFLIPAVALLFAVQACGGNGAPAQEAAATKMTGKNSRSPRFKNAGLDRIWPHYAALQTALAADDAKKAADAAGALSAAIGETPENAKLSAAVKAIGGEKDIARQRKSFALASTELIALVKKSGVTSGALYVQNCPMYAGGKGGDWLSAGKAIKNPYFGSEMLECGSVTETLK